jgi:hypothetical protein
MVGHCYDGRRVLESSGRVSGRIIDKMSMRAGVASGVVESRGSGEPDAEVVHLDEPMGNGIIRFA